ncbi:ribitol 5-phosphate transferase FKRP [Culicoides brevitarsis]|uniref:ribitol 5-phosphate transferase FKRP n=1 Tax=Culicoides brevitarsis TaxID=469753 RepID=UPI00307B300B
MRIKYTRLFIFSFVFLNMFVFYYTWKYLLTTKIVNSLTAASYSQPSIFNLTSHNLNSNSKQQLAPKPNDKQVASKHIKSTITVVFRGFFHFDNDLAASIQSILNVIPSMKVFLIYDEIPYPPLDVFNSTSLKDKVRLFTLDQRLDKNSVEMSPLDYIKTPYTLLMPDSVRLNARSTLQKILREINLIETKTPNNKKRIFVVPFASNNKHESLCSAIAMDLPNWTLEFSGINVNKKDNNNNQQHCDMFIQKHALILETSSLKAIPNAMTSPFPELFYIRAKSENFTLHVLNTTLAEGKSLFTAYHTKQEKKDVKKRQFKEMYKTLQIKKVVERTFQTNAAALKSLKRKQQQQQQQKGKKKSDEPEIQFNLTSTLLTTITYFGCEKNTKSCVGQVFNRRPFYTFINKHTPPCCIEKLKTVFHHVIEEIENVGIRYWLDNEALRDAIDSNHLSANAYEIDISFNFYDLQRSQMLKKAQVKPYLDDKGFYWIKATDGNYFKVQYSKMNQIGVNLLPYNIDSSDAKNNMATANGFFGWKSHGFDLDFLHPMSTVLFLGRSVASPNNVVEYLAAKEIKKEP